MNKVSTIVSKHSKAYAIPVLMTGLLIVFLISLGIGTVSISISEIITAIWHKFGLMSSSLSETQEVVLFDIRLPRLVQTVLIGSALGISGAALQGLFRNPLVEPGLIGISGGASLGAVIVIIFGYQFTPEIPLIFGNFLLPTAAFIGALMATFIVYFLAKSLGNTNITILILAGVAIMTLCQALIGLSIFYADDNQIRTYNFWTLGDLGGATWQKLSIVAPLIILPLIGILKYTRHLNAIAIGENEAFHMGINVERVKYLIITLSALAVGAAVSLAGMIGFIGLVIPHLIRLIFGPDHRIVLTGSILGGAILLIVADIFARTVVAPAELPIGIVTAMIGSPFFIYLLITAKKKSML